MNFMGMDGFIWFTGVVEERNDPLRLGRVKVRMFGLHSKKKIKGITEGIPTEDLPWAYPMQPITSAAMNGIGTTPLGPVEGTHVVGFFRDGKGCQDPVVMGTLGGFPLEAAQVAGFNDPNKLYPKDDKDISDKSYIKEPDTNRRAVGDFEDPISGELWFSKETALSSKEDFEDIGEREFDKEVKIADGKNTGTPNLTWDEPEDPFSAEYPFNHVRESESGHIEEWDDTPEAERLMRKHKSGTFEEIHPDGQKVTKIVSDNYQIVIGDEFIHIKRIEDEIGGNLYVTIEGSCHMKVEDDYNMEVGGDVNINVGGNWNEEIFGSKTVTIAETFTSESLATTKIVGSPITLNP
jgi:hypothetical protein